MDVGKKKAGAVGTEGYYKAQLDMLSKENRELKLKLDPLERENRALKKMVFDLSVKLDMLSDSKRLGKMATFDIDSALTTDAKENPTSASTTAATATGAPANAAAGASPFMASAATTLATGGSASSPVEHLQQQQQPPPATPSSALSAATLQQQVFQSMRDSLSSSAVTVRDRLRDGRHFAYKHELKGHNGAVYSIQYSPDGKILASGSFDKTVRLWDPLLQRQLSCLEGHRVNISDLCWSNDSNYILSASYDQTVKTWDINASKLVSSCDMSGFALSVKIDPSNNNIFYVGTSRNMLLKVDRRQSDVAAKFALNDAMVNALYVFRDGEYLMSGDSAGSLKTWDVRNTSLFASSLNDETKRAISHIQVSYRKLDDEEERYLAVNSYDNVLRVYDRGSLPPKTPLSLVHSVKGHQNKNWPIKSCFFHGTFHKVARSQQSNLGETLLNDGIDSASAIEDSGKEKSVHSTLLLATGSADKSAYIFDVGAPEGAHELIQKLDGHTDRVYSVNFHPTDPILATASADATIKIWTARSTRPQIIDSTGS